MQATSNGNMADLKFNYQIEGSGELLMMALPHHQQLLDSSVLRNQVSLDSLKVNEKKKKKRMNNT